MKANKFKLFFVNLFDLLVGKIISVKIAESEEKMRNELKLTEQCYREQNESLENSVVEMQLLLTPEKVEEILDPSLYKIKDKGLTIRVTEGYDKDKKYFHPSLPCWNNGDSEFIATFPFSKLNNTLITTYGNYNDKGNRSRFTETATTSIAMFVEALFSTNCVAKIDTDSAFKFKITKPGSLNWEDIIPKINEAIASLFPDMPKIEDEPAEILNQKVEVEGPEIEVPSE